MYNWLVVEENLQQAGGKDNRYYIRGYSNTRNDARKLAQDWASEHPGIPYYVVPLETYVFARVQTTWKGPEEG